MARSVSRLFFLLSLVFALAACGGVQIKPVKLTADRLTDGFTDMDNRGYIVYEPRILVNVSAVRSCSKPAEATACPATDLVVTGCTVGAPYYLPDYSRAYAVRVKPGVGSYSGSITISNGWLLSGAEGAGDTTAFLSLLAGGEALQGGQEVSCPEGIYEISRATGKPVPFWAPGQQ
ncbi:MAG TPA: hypothetical protein VF405_13640 [Gammaproteobacteria bacterium]